MSGTDVNVSDLSGTDQAAVTEVSEAVRVTAENVTQKPKGMESHAETQVRLTEAPAGVNESPVLVTEPENQITDASAEATEEPKATEAVTEAAVQTQGAGTASHGGESFTSELKPVPGFTDKIYRIKFDADMADESEKIYSVSGRNYRVKSPDAYTICIYDVIIYGYDYFDFLKKGDYVLKKEYEYTADEYFALDEQVLSMDELISSGFEAAPE